ncbi:MAG TPA: tetratricopeptide repeat protein, partial [Candidatus Polarisedimenticolia bacterium]|nr:tetratricopeptide repeat protein [Candidatus Polarisedimenticolia bacterium]
MRRRNRAAAALLGAVLLVAGASLAAATSSAAVGVGDSSSGEARPITDLVREADAAFDKGDYARARSLYDEVIRCGARDARVLGRLALLSSRGGDLDGSVRLYREALVLAPDDPDFLLELGRILVARKRYADAEALYRDMEERRIEPIRTHLGRAALLLAEGDLDKAGRFYRDVLRADHGNLEARIGMARVAHRLGLDRAARDQANNIVLDHPESREALSLKQEIDRALAPRMDPGASRIGDRGGNRV